MTSVWRLLVKDAGHQAPPLRNVTKLKPPHQAHTEEAPEQLDLTLRCLRCGFSEGAASAKLAPDSAASLASLLLGSASVATASRSRL